MREQFVNRFLTAVGNDVDPDLLERIRMKLIVLLQEYEISPVQTDLIPYQEMLPDCFKAFMVTKKMEGKSQKTLYSYNLYVRDLFSSLHKPIEDITTNDIRVYLYLLQEHNRLKNSSLDTRRACLSSFFSWCAAEGYIGRNPMATVRPIKFERKTVDGVSEIDLERVRRVCRDIRESAIIETMYSTGCRVSELSGLNISDVNLTTREVKLFGKGSKHRTSYLSPKAILFLSDYLKERPTDGDQDALFLNARQPHGRMPVRSIERLVTAIGARAGIDLHCHQLRHTMATEALRHGMDITQVQTLLGHSNINTTMIYARVSGDDVKTAHAKYV